MTVLLKSKLLKIKDVWIQQQDVFILEKRERDEKNVEENEEENLDVYFENNVSK